MIGTRNWRPDRQDSVRPGDGDVEHWQDSAPEVDRCLDRGLTGRRIDERHVHRQRHRHAYQPVLDQVREVARVVPMRRKSSASTGRKSGSSASLLRARLASNASNRAPAAEGESWNESDGTWQSAHARPFPPSCVSLRSLNAARPRATQSQGTTFFGRPSAGVIHARPTRRAGDISQRKRTLVEQAFGWMKTMAACGSCAHPDGPLATCVLTFTAAAYHIVGLRIVARRRLTCVRSTPPSAAYTETNRRPEPTTRGTAYQPP